MQAAIPSRRPHQTCLPASYTPIPYSLLPPHTQQQQQTLNTQDLKQNNIKVVIYIYNTHARHSIMEEKKVREDAEKYLFYSNIIDILHCLSLSNCDFKTPNKQKSRTGGIHRRILSNIYRGVNTYPSETIPENCRGRNPPKLIL